MKISVGDLVLVSGHSTSTKVDKDCLALVIETPTGNVFNGEFIYRLRSLSGDSIWAVSSSVRKVNC